MSDDSAHSTGGIERGPDYWNDHCSRCSDELADGRDATLCKSCSREIEMKRRMRGDRCERCDGHGYIYGTFCDLQRAMNGRDTQCPVCHGSGRVPYEPEDNGRLVPDGGHVEDVTQHPAGKALDEVLDELAGQIDDFDSARTAAVRMAERWKSFGKKGPNFGDGLLYCDVSGCEKTALARTFPTKGETEHEALRCRDCLLHDLKARHFAEWAHAIRRETDV